jgi:hypothetical protein
MSAENDDFIRRRIYGASPNDADDDDSPLHQRSLSQLWASVQADADDANKTPKPDADGPKDAA